MLVAPRAGNPDTWAEKDGPSPQQLLEIAGWVGKTVFHKNNSQAPDAGAESLRDLRIHQCKAQIRR
jgi:hypothetical protein